MIGLVEVVFVVVIVVVCIQKYDLDLINVGFVLYERRLIDLSFIFIQSFSLVF